MPFHIAGPAADDAPLNRVLAYKPKWKVIGGQTATGQIGYNQRAASGSARRAVSGRARYNLVGWTIAGMAPVYVGVK